MRVAVGAPTRFHVFDLAEQLEIAGHLDSLYTAYPRSRVPSTLSPRAATFPWLLAPHLLAMRGPSRRVDARVQVLFQTTFGRWMGRHLRRSDVVHVLSGFGIEAHQRARAEGALTICDRASTHIAAQDRILQDEFRRWGFQYPGIPKEIIARELEEYELCDLIFVPSSFVADSFIREGVPKTKLRKVPFGVDVRHFRSHPKKDDVFRVIFAGALSIRKGLPYLLEAIRRLVDIPMEVWLMGSAVPETRRLMQYSPDHVVHLGPLPRDQLPEHLSQGSVFVLPSIEEGLATVIGQALACGVPVIATPNSGAEELMSDGSEGLIVPARDPVALAAAIRRLRDDPQLRSEMARATQAKAATFNGWGNYAEQVLGHYRGEGPLSL